MQGNQNQMNMGPNWNYDWSGNTQPSQPNWTGNNNPVNFTQQPVTIPSTTAQRFVLPGRLVNDISEVQINEVPMDGSINVFPLRDLSHVYLKFWDNNGKFITTHYALVDDQAQQNAVGPSSSQMDELMAKITAMEKMVKTMVKRSYKNNSKGGDNNDK